VVAGNRSKKKKKARQARCEGGGKGSPPIDFCGMAPKPQKEEENVLHEKKGKS